MGTETRDSAPAPRTTTRPTAPSRGTLPTTPTAPVLGAPAYPSLAHRLLPKAVRRTLVSLGMWQDPTPLKPSAHLLQVHQVLTHYGWAQSLDFSPTGRMCIRGAQQFLETTGHVTPHDRERAVDYMQQTLQEHGVHLPFFAWNDLPGRPFQAVERLLNDSATAARTNGE